MGYANILVDSAVDSDLFSSNVKTLLFNFKYTKDFEASKLLDDRDEYTIKSEVLNDIFYWVDDNSGNLTLDMLYAHLRDNINELHEERVRAGDEEASREFMVRVSMYRKVLRYFLKYMEEPFKVDMPYLPFAID